MSSQNSTSTSQAWDGETYPQFLCLLHEMSCQQVFEPAYCWTSLTPPISKRSWDHSAIDFLSSRQKYTIFGPIFKIIFVVIDRYTTMI